MKFGKEIVNTFISEEVEIEKSVEKEIRIDEDVNEIISALDSKKELSEVEALLDKLNQNLKQTKEELLKTFDDDDVLKLNKAIAVMEGSETKKRAESLLQIMIDIARENGRKRINVNHSLPTEKPIEKETRAAKELRLKEEVREKSRQEINKIIENFDNTIKSAYSEALDYDNPKDFEVIIDQEEIDYVKGDLKKVFSGNPEIVDAVFKDLGIEPMSEPAYDTEQLKKRLIDVINEV